MKVNRADVFRVWLVISINIFALWMCATFAGLTLQGALDDLEDGQLARSAQNTTRDVFEALERLFWLTGERIEG